MIENSGANKFGAFISNFAPTIFYYIGHTRNVCKFMMDEEKGHQIKVNDVTKRHQLYWISRLSLTDSDMVRLKSKPSWAQYGDSLYQLVDARC